MTRVMSKDAPAAVQALPVVLPVLDVPGKSAPRTPEGVRLYAIGDIHGRHDLLKALQQRIDADKAAHPHRSHVEIYLGDYVDRGADSAGVLENLIDRQHSHGAICLSGNHEEMMLDALKTEDGFEHWLKVGGYQAALSYLDIAPPMDDPRLWNWWREALPARHLDFLHALGTYEVHGDYLFVHAGVRPGVPLPAQRREDMLWIRKLFLDSTEIRRHFVVHGHQPVPEVDVRSNRMDIDTKAFESGHLSCVVLDGAERFLIQT